jgi:hypothetical protein
MLRLLNLAHVAVDFFGYSYTYSKMATLTFSFRTKIASLTSTFWPKNMLIVHGKTPERRSSVPSSFFLILEVPGTNPSAAVNDFSFPYT